MVSCPADAPPGLRHHYERCRERFQTIRDLGSRYTIGPFALHTPTGRDIARWPALSSR